MTVRKRLRELKVLVFAALAGCGLGGAVQAEEAGGLADIQWLMSDVPPIGITNGPLAGKGLHGGIIRVLSGQPFDVRGIESHANIARLFVQIQSDNYCVPGLIKTADRAKTVHFTENPTAIIDSSHLIYSRKNQKLIDNLNGEVTLRELLEKGFVLGTGSGVSYGGEIDELIETHTDTGGVILHPAPNFIEPILSMVEKGRVDFFLAPPWIITWRFVAQGLEVRDDQAAGILTHPFQEASTKMSYFAACTKNGWGKKAVTTLDDLLSRPDIQNALARNAQVWMSVSAARRHFVK